MRQIQCCLQSSLSDAYRFQPVTYNAAGSQKDSLKYKITPPVLEASVIDGAVDPTPDTETFTVTVTPATAEVTKGGNQTFTSTVKDKDNAEVTGATVTWSVAAAEGTLGSSAINPTSGLLTVDSGETAAKLTVTATYTKDSKTYTGTATVTVKDAAQQGG